MSLPLAILLAAATPGGADCRARTVSVDGAPLWVDLAGEGATTVVFESGNGNDASVWEAIAPQVAAQGVRTFRYDRRGYGRSAPYPTANYRVENDVATLRGALAACGIDGVVVYVAHSYGGVLASLAMQRDPRTRAIVLVDAVVPGSETAASVRAVQAELRPQYAEVRREAPALARAVIPVVEALGRTVRLVNRTGFNARLPVFDIVAVGGSDKPQDIARWHAAHRRFVSASPAHRQYIDAAGSGHKVMQDRPDLIVSVIARAAAQP